MSKSTELLSKDTELLTACDLYLFQLSQRIIKEMKNIKARNKLQYSFDISLDTNNDKMKILRLRHNCLDLACKKYEAVQELKTLVNDKARFLHTLSEKRDLIKARNDSAGMIFLKVVGTILSLGVLTLFGLWKVNGRNFCNQVDDIILNKDIDPMYDGL